MRISDWSSDVCSSDLQHAAQQLDVLGKARVGGFELLHLAHRVHDRGVVAAAELAADFGQRAGGELLGEVHGDLARAGHRAGPARRVHVGDADVEMGGDPLLDFLRSEEHTSELQSLMRISYAVFCLKKKKTNTNP